MNPGKWAFLTAETNFSVIQFGKSAVTRLYLVGNDGDIADTEVACDYSFSGDMATGSSGNIIRGRIGSNATLKYFRDGLIFIFSIHVIDI